MLVREVDPELTYVVSRFSTTMMEWVYLNESKQWTIQPSRVSGKLIRESESTLAELERQELSGEWDSCRLSIESAP